MYQNFCIYFSVEGYHGCLQFMTTINMVAMNIEEHVSLLNIGASSGYMPRSDIAGSSVSTMSNFLRNHQTYFQSGCTSLQSHKQWRSVSLPPHPLQHLLSPEVFILAILTGVRWNLRAILITFPLWLRMLNISLGASWIFKIPQLRMLFFFFFFLPHLKRGI